MNLFQLNSDGRVSVHGNLDRDTLATNWWDMLSSGERETLKSANSCTIDLSDVERIDSAGLAWLVNAVRDGRQHKVDITLRDVPDKLVQLARISEVDTLLPMNRS